VSCSIRIKASAARELRKLERSVRDPIVRRIDALAENPYAGSVLKGDLTGLRRIRVGEYRIIYELREHELVVLVVRVAHRREAYRRR
jgi:mRNA interferase RelE/StbE